MSNQTLEYRGFFGSIEASLDDGILHGKVLWIRDTIVYEGETLAELEQDFRGAVDDYLELCEQKGISPDAPCSGTFQIRIGPSLHRRARIAAHTEDVSLNEFVASAIQMKLEQQNAAEIHHHHHYGSARAGSGSTYSVPFHYQFSQADESWRNRFNIVRH